MPKEIQPIEDIGLVAFLIQHDVKTEDGMSLDFKNHQFMIDVYEDMYSLERDIVGLKAAQVTFTTTATNAVLCICKNKHIDIIYTLPTYDDVRIFSGGKVNRIIAQNPVYQAWVPDKDTMEQKIIGDNVIHFRGTHLAKAATMVASDLNVHDEVDSSNMKVVEQYSTRLQHSHLKRTWWFSHPSVPDVGVDAKWKLSDQKHWIVQCPECKKSQYVSWPESFDIEKERYICKACSGTITPLAMKTGRWVPRSSKRSAKISGYWIPLWLMPKVTAHDIIEYFQTKPADYFYNKVLGLPYAGVGNKVNQAQIIQNTTRKTWKRDAGRLIMGVDPGETIRWVIGNRDGLVRYGESKDYSSVERFLKDSERSIVVIDAGGDLIEPRRLRKAYPGRVFLCHYQKDRKTMQLVRWGESDEFGNVLADRNRMIQLVVDEFAEKKIPLHYTESPDQWHDYWLHFSHIYRAVEINESTDEKQFVWKRFDRDDWVHATVYWKVGMLRFGGKGKIIGGFKSKPDPNSYIITPDNRTSINPLKKPIDEALRRATIVRSTDSGDWRDA